MIISLETPAEEIYYKKVIFVITFKSCLAIVTNLVHLILNIEYNHYLVFAFHIHLKILYSFMF